MAVCGVALLAGSALQRFGVFEAGVAVDARPEVCGGAAAGAARRGSTRPGATTVRAAFPRFTAAARTRARGHSAGSGAVRPPRRPCVRSSRSARRRGAMLSPSRGSAGRGVRIRGMAVVGCTQTRRCWPASLPEPSSCSDWARRRCARRPATTGRCRVRRQGSAPSSPPAQRPRSPGRISSDRRPAGPATHHGAPPA